MAELVIIRRGVPSANYVEEGEEGKVGDQGGRLAVAKVAG